MLTGKIPYDADTAAGQLVRRLTDPVPDILQLRPDLPGGVQEVIARSLAKRRYVRFPTASDMAQALDAVAQGRSPRETLVLDKNRTVSGGKPIRAGTDGSLKPRLVKKPTLQHSQPRSLLLRGAGLLAGLLLLTALFYFGWQAADAGFGNGEAGIGGLAAGQTATMQAAGDPAAALSAAGSVAEVNGRARVQVPGQEALVLSEGMVLADVSGLRVWSESGSLKLVLESGAEVWLAAGTEISLPEESSRTAFAHLQLARQPAGESRADPGDDRGAGNARGGVLRRGRDRIRAGHQPLPGGLPGGFVPGGPGDAAGPGCWPAGRFRPGPAAANRAGRVRFLGRPGWSGHPHGDFHADDHRDRYSYRHGHADAGTQPDAGADRDRSAAGRVPDQPAQPAAADERAAANTPADQSPTADQYLGAAAHQPAAAHTHDLRPQPGLTHGR